ncbi:flagellar biosynthesis protein FlgA [Brevibacillus humidisoli]|uniref:flagellar biosynthesis protein FlgA n=1 Tax=Brevibacillus humidisoli TaxID=2895522 RepID=UPI001E31E51D|nr:flagellar biosynthesis protein FlgA [Brevibacillus humidisoli]UFJ40589.1 flagellar biosynthesis protein FlgA [Brevibacillus humidisoli]
MKKKTLLIISLISFLLAGGSLYGATRYLEVLAQEKLFAPVVKVAEGRVIAPYEPITQNDVVVVQEEVDELLEGSFSSLEEVVGKYSIQMLFADEQIVGQKLSDAYLLPDPGKARYEFPLNSILPVTELRKGDHVKVWVRYKSQDQLELLPPPATFQINSPSAEKLFETQLVSVKDSNGAEIYTLEPQLLPGGTSMGDAFFHASENRRPAGDERRYRDYRAQPTSIPAFIGFNLTDKQYETLIEAMQYGTIQIGYVLREKGDQAS